MAPTSATGVDSTAQYPRWFFGDVGIYSKHF